MDGPSNFLNPEEESGKAAPFPHTFSFLVLRY